MDRAIEEAFEKTRGKRVFIISFLLHKQIKADIIQVEFSKKGCFKMKVTKDSIIGDILDFDRTTAEYFLEIGMHCLGCPSSRGETIGPACMVHGNDCNELVEKLNQHLAAK